MDERHFNIISIIIVFSFVGFLFYLLTPGAGYLIYVILDFAAIALFLAAAKKKKNMIKEAVLLGLFLMAFDWVVENAGAVAGLWTTHRSVYPVWFVPIAPAG
ncbi:MAG: hypothetical protein HY518_05050 [Candidatus Aenigmarchaeota archaeon]|nr:hypothetical protein [Candidatus Aenigmarchaeota archaeon]